MSSTELWTHPHPAQTATVQASQLTQGCPHGTLRSPSTLLLLQGDGLCQLGNWSWWQSQLPDPARPVFPHHPVEARFALPGLRGTARWVSDRRTASLTTVSHHTGLTVIWVTLKFSVFMKVPRRAVTELLSVG